MAYSNDIAFWYTPEQGDILLPAEGRTLSVSDIELSREDRTTSGRLVRDVISVKKRITLSYSLLSRTNFAIFKYAYDATQVHIKIYQYSTLGTTTPAPDDLYDEYIVVLRPLEYTREYIYGNEQYYSGVSVEMNEV